MPFLIATGVKHWNPDGTLIDILALKNLREPGHKPGDRKV